MPKYLVMVSYNAVGAQGLLKEGGRKRVEAAKHAMKSAGAKLEALYFAFGEHDVYAILDAPDNSSVAALSLAVNGSGAATTRTVVLLTPEEMDKAAKKHVEYAPPGQ